ncbi:MAG TPA: helicase SNF2 [Gammaproteobacteria bacterium]|nr:helicase SNF2 [Gammaproteobacteria bacterium]
MHLLKRGDIRAACGGTYYSRGVRYFEAGRVEEVADIRSEGKDQIFFSARVKGSHRDAYRQQIFIQWLDDECDIDGYCSCPVHMNCKHVAAACLQFLELARLEMKEGTSAALSWLGELVVAGFGEQAVPPGEFMAYLLGPGMHPGIVQVDYMAVRRKKNGAFGRPRKLQYHTVTSYNAPVGLQPQDREILDLMAVSRGNAWRENPLQGPAGAVALSRMLATGRSYWEMIEEEGALAWSNHTRRLTLAWNRKSRGSLQLAVSTQPAALVLLTDPPAYLDTQEGVVGPLDTLGFTYAQLSKLLNAPPLTRKEARQFSRELLLRFPELALPPPVELNVTEVEGFPPVPTLDLCRDVVDGREVHMMRIGFDYGGQRVPALPPVEQLTQESARGLVRITRDLEQEQVALERLVDAGCQVLADSGSGELAFYAGGRNLLESASRWHKLIEELLPELEREGWVIRYDSSFALSFSQSDSWWGELEEADGGWFSMSLDVEIEGQRMPLLPLLGPVLEAYTPDELPEKVHLPLGEHQYLVIPGEKLQPWIEIIIELFDREPPQDDALRVSLFDAARVAELEDNSGISWRGGERLRQLGRRLRDFDGIETVEPPESFVGQLRDYQQRGYDWLHFLHQYELGGILADDMGLGKTVQTLAFIASQKERGQLEYPALVVAPTSLMSNWQREAAQFAPDLRVLVLQGSQRHERFAQIAEHDLVLTTYPLLPRDHTILEQQPYSILVLDEAQVVKNPKSQAAQVVRRLNAGQRLCLTGTPMENHLGELWTQFDFLMPGFLGDQKTFSRLYRTPVEKHGDAEVQARLARRVAPFMLRRSKDQVEKDLPQKTEIVRSVSLGRAQAGLYESIRLSMEKKVRKAIASKGLARSHIMILDALLKLRQACCDPRLVKLKAAARVKQSAKLEMLLELLPEMLDEGRRVLLFSQFTSMLGLIEQELKALGVRYSKLTGQTRKRDEAIERFTSGAADVFLISLKAGGVGLNLVAADTVILYDPWWNPAAESQAMDRAHRIGQKKPVFVYKLFTEGTVEEKILALQEKKKALAEGLYRKGKGDAFQLTQEDLDVLFEPLSVTRP